MAGSDWSSPRRVGGVKLVPAMVAFAIAVLLPALVRAQSGIGGVVKDSSGAVLPGVTVEAASPALIEKTRTAITDGEGQYKIIDLRPGVYTVTFTLPGFSTVKREGIDLPSSFTATVNADMRVGALEETVTVSGEAPAVDIQNTSQVKMLSKELLESVPTATRLPQSYTVNIPGAVLPASTAGGAGLSNTTYQGGISIHGSRGSEHNVTIDGFTGRNMTGSGGGGFYYYPNPATFQEVVVSTGSSGAEQQMAGIVTNIIPKEGGNTYNGMVYYHYVGEGFVGDNLTDELKAQGVSGTSSIRRDWDFNPAVGGPIKKSKLWFFGSYRNAGSEADAAVRYNLTPTTWLYTPDTSRATAGQKVVDTNYSLRLTWQAAQKHKFSAFYDDQPKTWHNRTIGATVSPEASTYSPYTPQYLVQGVWKSPISSRLLLEAGTSYQNSLLWLNWNDDDPNLFNGPSGSTPDRNAISATDQATTMIYRAAGPIQNGYGIFATSKSLRSRASMTYVTGSHAFKGGMELLQGEQLQDWRRNGDYTATVRNGVCLAPPCPPPSTVSITLWAPYHALNTLKGDLGLYVQDQWTLRRATINAGVRYDYLNAYVPAQDVYGNRWIPARSFGEIDDLPLWHDVSPRFGVAYDLFGNGKTAIKATLNRYVQGQAVSIAVANNPQQTSVLSANRTWSDTTFGPGDPRSGNFIPDCDFNNPAINGECGILSNTNFGQNNPRATRFDPDTLTGYGKRNYNWEVSTGIQHELTRGLAVNFGYFRRWYGLFSATDNLAVTPADYDHYCVTMPVDARLPNSGQQVCGFYDVSLAKAGQQQNFVTFENHFGTRTEVYNGLDLTVNARLPNGVQMTGGLSTGRIAVDTCFVVDSPGTQAILPGSQTPSTSISSWTPQYCNTTPPFQPNVKFFAMYPLPWYGLQVSGTVSSVPGPEISVSDILIPSSQILPSLGRNLSAGATAFADLPLMQPGTMFAERTSRLDLRLTKIFRIGSTRVQGSADVLNVFNSSAPQLLNTRYGPDWLKPTQILGARMLRLAAQFDF